jgi:hypothetical protein
MNEEWRAVVGYEGLYEVSNMGRVKSLSRYVFRPHGKPYIKSERMMSPYIDRTSTGYLSSSLCKGGKATKVNIHVVVLEAFVGPRPTPAHESCHDNGIRSDARLSNLRWDTASGNKVDELRHGTRSRGERNGVAVLTDELAQWVRESKQSSLRLAPILGVASSTIRSIRIGQNWGWQCASA